MVRSTRSQKVERLNAAYRLLAQGITPSEAALQLSQRFGLSQRQAYRYVQDARAMTRQAEPAEPLLPIRRHRKVCIQNYVRPHNPAARPQRAAFAIL